MKHLRDIGKRCLFPFILKQRKLLTGRRFSFCLITGVFLFCFSCTNVIEKLESYNSYLDILSVSPSAGSTGVVVTSPVTVVFNEDVDMSTVSSSTFIVNDGATTGTFTYNPSSKTLTFTPDLDLLYSTLYTVNLTEALRNTDGNYIDSGYTWSFTTNQYYFNVLSVYPLNGETAVPVNSDIVVQFDDNINLSTVNNTTFQVNGGLAGAASVDATQRTITFNPAADLPASTLCTVTLTTGIQNITGQTMASNFTWTFTTGTLSLPEIYILTPEGLDILSSYTYDMGNAVNASTTNSAVFTIGNSGDFPLTISGVSLTDLTNYNFTLSSTNVTAGGAVTLTVNFVPNSSVGTKTALVAINSDDSDENPFYINLTGESLAAPAPEIQITDNGIILVSPTSTVDFGTITIGDTGSKTIVIHNIGSAPLNITGVAMGGTNPDYFSTVYTGGPIAAGSTANVVIDFSAPVKINAKATITFTNNDADEGSFVVKLKGRTMP